MDHVYSGSEMPLSRSNTTDMPLPNGQHVSRGSHVARALSERLRNVRDYAGNLAHASHAGDSVERQRSETDHSAFVEEEVSAHFSMTYASIDINADYGMLGARLSLVPESNNSIAEKSGSSSSVVQAQSANQGERTSSPLKVVNGTTDNVEGCVAVQRSNERTGNCREDRHEHSSCAPRPRKQWRRLTSQERLILAAENARAEGQLILRRQTGVARVYARLDYLTVFSMQLDNWLDNTHFFTRHSLSRDAKADLKSYRAFQVTLMTLTRLIAKSTNEGDVDAWDYMVFLLQSLEHQAQKYRIQNAALRASLSGMSSFPSAMGLVDAWS